MNRYDKPVDGVRYTVQMIIPGSTPRILDTSSKESDLAVESGETKPSVSRSRIHLRVGVGDVLRRCDAGEARRLRGPAAGGVGPAGK